LRLRSRLTQEELGRIVGISESAVNRHESGDRRLDLETLRAYARAFKVPTVALFMRPDEIGDAEAPAWDEQNFTGGDDAFFRSAAGI
jgi:transcriptional regulator with XRE-family HTH domain